MGDEPELLMSCVLCERLTPQPDALVSNPLCRDCVTGLQTTPVLASLAVLRKARRSQASGETPR